MIALDCRYVRSRVSGLLSYSLALADHLPRLAPDLEFLFITHPHAERRLAVTSNAHEVVFPHVPCGPATMWGLAQLVDLRGVRVFHAPFNILPVGLTMPTVTTIHDVMWLEQPSWVRPRGAWARFVEQGFMQYGIRRALVHSTRIAASSQATVDAIAALRPDAATRTRVTDLGVGGRFRPPAGPADAATARAARRRWLPGAERYLLTVGQYAPYKNHEAVVRAFARVFSDDPDTHLALVQRRGDGPADLSPLVRRLRVERRVHFLRDVPLCQLVALCWGALALCHPSLCEGFGNPPLEAMAAGCPVITSDRAPMRDIAGEAALLVDPERVDAIAGAMRRVANDGALRAELRARGLHQAAKYPWRATAEATLAIYRELC